MLGDSDFFPGVETHYQGSHYAVLDAGAHVLAWTPREQVPVLWVSPLAVFEPGVAVRGGVPVVFPWFGAGPSGDRTPAHGFARTAAWERVGLVDEVAANGRLEVRHRLTSEGFDSSPFSAELVSEFARDHLRVSLSVTNTGTADFSYEEALHTYLAVSDVARISLEGLDGCSYIDKVDGGERVQAGPVRFTGETDRLYSHTGDVVVDDPDWCRKIRVSKEGSAVTVVWNPGAARGASLSDVAQYWPGFVCVEAANSGDRTITVPSGETHTLTQMLQLV
jgi:glucose-6-phosphate 1-epimerase